MNQFINLFCLIFLLQFVYNLNLRKGDENINNLDSLLKNIPIIYDSLYTKMLSEKSNISKDLTSSYFKKLENNSKVKFYLNKDSNDFQSIIDDMIISMGISNKNHAYIRDIFYNKISLHDEYFDNKKWMNFNIITTVRNDENTISFASLYADKNNDKFDFIFCFGFGDFNKNFNGENIVDLGVNQNTYKEISQTYTSSSSDFPDSNDENYLIHFMNLIGFKILGNKYNLDLPYPEFN